MTKVPLFLPSEHGFLPPSIDLAPASAPPVELGHHHHPRAGHWVPATSLRVRRVEAVVVAAMIGFLGFGLLRVLGVA